MPFGARLRPTLGQRAGDLKFTVQLGSLTSNHVPLVTALRAIRHQATIRSRSPHRRKSMNRVARSPARQRRRSRRTAGKGHK
jgi:cell division septation protein DedD